MRKKLVFLSMAALLFMKCFEPNNITGSDDVITYSNTVFEVTETASSSSYLTASGTVENTGLTSFYAPWYVEADFYADSTYDFKLGGEKYMITFSLEPDEKTGWELKFSSNLYQPSDYPNFAVKNLRAYKEHD